MTFHQGYSLSSLNIEDTNIIARSSSNATIGKSDSPNKFASVDWHPDELMRVTTPDADSSVFAS
jgi:hypothetical protein